MTSLWQDTAAEHVTCASLTGAQTADLVIVGGGYTGCAAALEAAGAGHRTILLEAETIGHGGSGRNVGLVNAGLWLPPDAVEESMGPEAGAALNAALAAAPDLVFDLVSRHGIACEARRAGTIHLAHAPAGQKDLANRARQLKARDAPVQLLDAAEVTRRIGSAHFHGGLFDPRAGTIQPLAYMRGLARAAQGAGTILYENSALERIVHVDGHWRVHSAHGQVTARHLLMATNAYHRFVPGFPVPRTATVGFFQVATPPLPDDIAATILPEGEGCWDTGTVMTSLRRDRAGRIILGALGIPEGMGAALHHDWAHRKLRRIFPDLAPQDWTHHWWGRIAMTRDHIPKVVDLGRNAWAVLGYSGRGIGPGTLMGQCAARGLMTGDPSNLPVPLSPNGYRDSFPVLRSAVVETGARALHWIGARRS